MTVFTARWVLPIIGPPIEDGAVAVAEGRIRDVGRRCDLVERQEGQVVDVGEAVILPGFVNAHTHLEWSHVRGKIGAKACFSDWLRAIILQRYRPYRQKTRRRAIETAIEEIVASGTIAIGEVTNNGVAVPAIIERGLLGVIFVEILTFGDDTVAEVVEKGERLMKGFPETSDVVYALTPHAPYTVPRSLFRIFANRTGPLSVHLAESFEEVEFLTTGSGPFEILVGPVWEKGWYPPGMTPVRYLDHLGLLRPGTIIVHAVWVDDHDIFLLRERQVSVCLCPRSNLRTGVGPPPVEKFVKAGVQVALGTDSLASNTDLDLRNEMVVISQIVPALPLSVILRMATLGGARALGLDHRIGSLERGKEARLIAVRAEKGAILEPETFIISSPEDQTVIHLTGNQKVEVGSWKLEVRNLLLPLPF
jgi:cytosine/adenosine deaminase-related metal-dependent hydrolase